MIVLDARPHCEGLHTLRRLASAGVKVSYLLVSAAPYVMPEVTKVSLASSSLSLSLSLSLCLSLFLFLSAPRRVSSVPSEDTLGKYFPLTKALDPLLLPFDPRAFLHNLHFYA